MRAFNDAYYAVSARTDALLEGPPDDCLYRHAESGIVCAADARIDSVPNLTGAGAAPHSPTAILAQAYLHFGVDFLSSILGDFAGVLWDPRHRRLLLFVDRAGSRDVFFRGAVDTVLFSTDLRHMTAAQSGKADFDRLLEWVLNPATGATAGGGVSERVPPGHMAIVERDTVTLRRYWDPANAPDIRFRKSEDYVDAAEALLEETVRCRLPRRLKVGCHLSGGLDSPLIAGITAKLLAKSGRTLTAFTATHTDPDIPAVWPGLYWDEHRQAAAFAARFTNIEHVQVSTDAAGLFDGLESFLAAAGQPPRSLLALWATRYAVAAEGRQQHISVMLTGTCGNETITQDGGSALAYLLQHGRFASLTHAWIALWRNGTPMKKIAGTTIVPLLPSSLHRPILNWAGVAPAATRMDFTPLAQDLRTGLAHDHDHGNGDTLPHWPSPRQIVKHLAKFSGSEVSSWYRQGFGIDMRLPFTDSRILEFCAGLPPDQFCGDGEYRHLARRLLRRLGAPDELVNETRRGIQYANWHSAMMRERPALYRRIEALEANATASRLLDLAEMRRLVNELPSATPTSRSDLMKYGNRLSVGLSLGRFVLHLEGSNAGPPLTDLVIEDWQPPPDSSISN
jgi:asparagine synthase (glutamine-hydrolysing)